jgi:hypothetical protein
MTPRRPTRLVGPGRAPAVAAPALPRSRPGPASRDADRSEGRIGGASRNVPALDRQSGRRRTLLATGGDRRNGPGTPAPPA